MEVIVRGFYGRVVIKYVLLTCDQRLKIDIWRLSSGVISRAYIHGPIEKNSRIRRDCTLLDRFTRCNCMYFIGCIR